MAEPMSDERLQELKETNRILRRTGMAQLIAEVERLRNIEDGGLELEIARLEAHIAAADKLIEGWDLSHKNVACLHDPPRKCVCGLNQARDAYWKLKEKNDGNI